MWVPLGGQRTVSSLNHASSLRTFPGGLPSAWVDHEMQRELDPCTEHLFDVVSVTLKGSLFQTLRYKGS